MSVTYGFYDSLNGDRTYNAKNFSQIFDGIINDGVFMSIGTNLKVEATDSMMVHVGIGRAWFNSTWTFNDAILPLTVEQSELVLNRIDTVVLEINTTDQVRANTIKIIKGKPATEPVATPLVRTDDINQYALGEIYVGKGVELIKASNITNKVGTKDTPFITGILKTIEVEDLLSKWNGEWADWNVGKDLEFYTWFEEVKDVLSDDVAGNLLNLIKEAQTQSVINAIIYG